MEIHIQQYFKKEKEGAQLFILVGAVAVVASVIMLYHFPNSSLVQGTAYALIAVGLLQLGVGLNILWRTNKQTQDLLHQFNHEPTQFYSQEINRMEKVMSNFKITRKVELTLVIIGMVLALLGSLGKMGFFLIGTGLGLCVQSVASLLLDLSAEWRGGLYLYHLKKEGK